MHEVIHEDMTLGRLSIEELDQYTNEEILVFIRKTSNTMKQIQYQVTRHSQPTVFARLGMKQIEMHFARIVLLKDLGEYMWDMLGTVTNRNRGLDTPSESVVE